MTGSTSLKFDKGLTYMISKRFSGENRRNGFLLFGNVSVKPIKQAGNTSATGHLPSWMTLTSNGVLSRFCL